MKAMFSTYGGVEDVSILRNADGKSKGECICGRSGLGGDIGVCV